MIAGLDLSTARIGLAHGDGKLSSIQAHAGPGDRGRRLHELGRRLTLELRRRPPLPALVCIEAPLPHGPGTVSLTRQAEVRGVVLRDLFELDVPFVEVLPSNLKRFATGNGSASKEAMIAAAIAEGADDVLNDDEADAFHLRRMARCAYGLDRAAGGDELDALSVVAWPTVPGLSGRISA